MIRLEIVANQSVEENILDAFIYEKVGKYYTKFSNIYGVGTSGPRMGDAVWPEENFALVIWCEEEEARGILRAVEFVKRKFPDEGIKVFGLPPAIKQTPASTKQTSAEPSETEPPAVTETKAAETGAATPAESPVIKPSAETSAM